MGKGAGSNLYRRGQTWWARVQIAGRDVRRSLRTSDRAEARKRLKSILEDAERIRFGDDVRHRYEDAAVAWAEASFGGVRERSAERYRTSLRMMHEHFGALYLDQINPKSIGRFVRARRGDGAGNATIRRDLSAGSRLFANAIALGWVEENPFKAWDRSVIRQRRFVIERVDRAAYAAVLDQAAPMFAGFMRFLLATGLRAGEAQTLKRADIDLGEARATVSGKTGRRTIALSPEAVAIARAVPQHLSSPYLFWSPSGARYSRPSQRFTSARASAQKAAHKAGRAFKPFRLHDLRHEYAIRFLENHGSLYRLQQHLGHSSVKTTEIYCEFLTPEQAQAAKGLSAQTPAQTKRIAAAKPLAERGES